MPPSEGQTHHGRRPDRDRATRSVRTWRPAAGRTGERLCRADAPASVSPGEAEPCRLAYRHGVHRADAVPYHFRTYPGSYHVLPQRLRAPGGPGSDRSGQHRLSGRGRQRLRQDPAGDHLESRHAHRPGGFYVARLARDQLGFLQPPVHGAGHEHAEPLRARRPRDRLELPDRLGQRFRRARHPRLAVREPSRSLDRRGPGLVGRPPGTPDHDLPAGWSVLGTVLQQLVNTAGTSGLDLFITGHSLGGAWRPSWGSISRMPSPSGPAPPARSA